MIHFVLHVGLSEGSTGELFSSRVAGWKGKNDIWKCYSNIRVSPRVSYSSLIVYCYVLLKNDKNDTIVSLRTYWKKTKILSRGLLDAFWTRSVYAHYVYHLSLAFYTGC